MTMRRAETDEPMDMESDTASGSGSGLELTAHHPAPHVAHTETVVATPLSPMSPTPVIKQEPRVEVSPTQYEVSISLNQTKPA